MSLAIRITRIDPTLPLPQYQTAGAVAFDLSIRTDAAIPPHGIVLVPANVIVEVPDGYALLLVARSSLHKRGLMLANQIGIIDQDFCGSHDEIHLALRNTTNAAVHVPRGERIAQGLFVPIARATWGEVPLTVMERPSRGGFGSTGTTS